MCGDLHRISRNGKLRGVLTKACSLGTWEVEAGGLRAEGQSQLHSKLEASLGYTGPPSQRKEWGEGESE